LNFKSIITLGAINLHTILTFSLLAPYVAPQSGIRMTSSKFAIPFLAASVIFRRHPIFQLSFEFYLDPANPTSTFDTNPEIVEEHNLVGDNLLFNHSKQLNKTISSVERFPYVAFLYFEQANDTWRCGGTLIAEDIVLTAAHCIPKHDNYSSVTLGGYETYDDRVQENFSINHYEIHPQFVQEGFPTFDLALVRLEKCSGRAPISLSQTSIHNQKLQDGKFISVMHWEDTFDSRGYEQTTTIRDTYVNLDNKCHPWRSRKDLGTLTRQHICTSASLEPSLSPTRGDSGGGLIIKGEAATDDVQIGVISFGYSKKSSSRRIPTVHSDVGSSIDWITSAKNTLSRC